MAGTSAFDGTVVEKLGSNSMPRSITDFPPELISKIFNLLDPKELGIVSCVSTLFNGVVADDCRWKDFYCYRWEIPSGLTHVLPPRSWKELFAERKLRSKLFMGSFTVNTLSATLIASGYTEDERCGIFRNFFLLQSARLFFTAGTDDVVRMWDLEEGLVISVSKPIGCRMFAIAADTKLLVAGGTGKFIQCWRAIEGQPHLFDIAGVTVNQTSEFRLWGHEGPVSCLALDSARIFSGSWDKSIRIWDRTQLNCMKILRHEEEVHRVATRGSFVASAAGENAFVWDIDKGNRMVLMTLDYRYNAVNCMAWSHMGDMLFITGIRGPIHMFEVANCRGDDDFKLVATWNPHENRILSLAFEFPWLVFSSINGSIALINVEKLLGSSQCTSHKHDTVIKQLASGGVWSPERTLDGIVDHTSYYVTIVSDRIVCGGQFEVTILNFSQALDIEEEEGESSISRIHLAS